MAEPRFVQMDARIEEYLWHDFHPNMIVSIQSWLMPQLLPKYAAQIEERVYVERIEPAPHAPTTDPDTRTTCPPPTTLPNPPPHCHTDPTTPPTTAPRPHTHRFRILRLAPAAATRRANRKNCACRHANHAFANFGVHLAVDVQAVLPALARFAAVQPVGGTSPSFGQQR